MAKNNNLNDFLTDIANAIRAKKGTGDPINAQNFASEISSIESGSGTDGSIPDMPVIGDGKTYLYIKIAAPGRMTVPLYFSQTVANGVTIDWGDGSATQTLSGTGNRNTTHTYTEIGEYTISLNPTSGCKLGLGHNSSSYCVMGSTDVYYKVYCNMLKAVEIGRSVTSIDNYAFYDCYSLSSIIIPESVTSIGNYAVCNCRLLSSIVIPGGVTIISENAFRTCYSLSSVIISDSVTSIDNYAFYDCYSLSSIVIPDSVTSISNYAFSSCYSLSSIVIPDSVTSISNYAFYQCRGLSSIVIPGSVTSIGNNAFLSCLGMAFYDFSALAAVPSLSSTTVFKNIPSDCKIIVPDALYDEWIAATNWDTYASYIIKKTDWDALQ